VPEIIEAITKLPAHELVLDGEAIALDENGRARPFQVTMRRFGRKLDVEALRAELPIQGMFFDCLRIDGASIADKPASERFDALTRALPEGLRVPRLITDSASETIVSVPMVVRYGESCRSSAPKLEPLWMIRPIL